MSLNEAVSADRVHIGFFGKRNAGKSSLVNAVTGQRLAVVSDVLGTTTDPVKKTMELLPIGPVMIIDTPGFDDVGELGEMRVEKTREILAKTDVAVLVTDASEELDPLENDFISLLSEKKIAYIVVHNKSDKIHPVPEAKENHIWVSAVDGVNIDGLKEKLGELSKGKQNKRRIVADFISRGDIVVLVTPIDESAPKGRLILPQQQTIRDILDSHAVAVVCQPEELVATLSKLTSPPKMVITDSQVFGKVAPMVPESVPLTSFSILFARYKGELLTQVRGAAALTRLKSGDRVLIAEGCTHHRQCGDIGTVKLPKLIEKTVGFRPELTFTSGGEFPADLSQYKLVIHCGACMLNEAEVAHRIGKATEAGVPVVNYGMAIAYMNGILERSLSIFPEALLALTEKTEQSRS